MTESDNFYLQQDEPIKDCLLALQQIILLQDKEVTNASKYGMLFLLQKEKCLLFMVS